MKDWISSIPLDFSGRPDRCDLTPENLQKRKNGLNNQAYLRKFNRNIGFDFNMIREHSCHIYQSNTSGVYEVIPVAKTWYPEGGYLGWHTDDVGGRLYATWAEGKSFFRYQDPITKEIITSWDKPKQWTFRIFTFDEENPLWHCVGAEDVRISVGYRFVHK